MGARIIFGEANPSNELHDKILTITCRAIMITFDLLRRGRFTNGLWMK